MTKPLITKKNMIQMDQTASSIKGVLDDLRVKLSILDGEIKADKKSKAEFERHLGLLQKRKDELTSRMKENKAWATTYDRDVGPFADRYKAMTADIAVIYEKAKVGHAKGITMLKQEFGYHPEFKRPGDSFFGIPYTPL